MYLGDNGTGSTCKSNAAPTYTRAFLRGLAKQLCSPEILCLIFKILMGLEGTE